MLFACAHGKVIPDKGISWVWTAYTYQAVDLVLSARTPAERLLSCRLRGGVDFRTPFASRLPAMWGGSSHLATPMSRVKPFHSRQPTATPGHLHKYVPDLTTGGFGVRDRRSLSRCFNTNLIPYPCGRLSTNFVRNRKAFNGALHKQWVGTQP